MSNSKADSTKVTRDPGFGNRSESAESRVPNPEPRWLASRVTRHASRFVRFTALAALCTACMSPPKVPDYNAAWPEMVEPSAATSGAIYQSGHDVALFENSVARRVGDSVTIRLVESTNASKTSTTATKKKTGDDIGVGKGVGALATVKGAPFSLGLDNK